MGGDQGSFRGGLRLRGARASVLFQRQVAVQLSGRRLPAAVQGVGVGLTSISGLLLCIVDSFALIGKSDGVGCHGVGSVE